MYIACALLGWLFPSYHLNIDKKKRKSVPRHNPSVRIKEFFKRSALV